MSFTPVHETLCESVRERFPALNTCTSATEASRVMFGVQGMVKFIALDDNGRAAIVDFFGDNHSDMIAWAKLARVGTKYNSAFHAEPEHRQVYKRMVADFGLPLTVRLTQSRDFGDVATGYTWLRGDKARWRRFDSTILAALPKFPAAMHANMIHDYALHSMQTAERAVRRKAAPAPVKVATLPAFDVPSQVVTNGETFKIMVPRTANDLRRIGDAQRHCVGTAGMGYGERIKEGRICIVAIYQESLGDGICVEFDLIDNLDVLQAQGRHRRGPTERENAAIKEVAKALADAPTPERCDQCFALTGGLGTVNEDDETVCEDCD